MPKESRVKDQKENFEGKGLKESIVKGQGGGSSRLRGSGTPLWPRSEKICTQWFPCILYSFNSLIRYILHSLPL